MVAKRARERSLSAKTTDMTDMGYRLRVCALGSPSKPFSSKPRSLRERCLFTASGFTVASLTLVNPLTAQVLLDAADHTSSADDVLLATAAGSSVGGLLTTLHLRRGGSLIALVRRADAARQYHERFPDVPVVSTADPDWPALVRKAAGSRRIGIALDAVGGTLPRPLASLLADRGTLISYGMLARGSTTLESLNLIGRQLLLRGVNVGSWFARPPAQRRARPSGRSGRRRRAE